MVRGDETDWRGRFSPLQDVVARVAGAAIQIQWVKRRGDVDLRVIDVSVVGAVRPPPTLRLQISQIGGPVPRFRMDTDQSGPCSRVTQFADGFIHASFESGALRHTGILWSRARLAY